MEISPETKHYLVLFGVTVVAVMAGTALYDYGKSKNWGRSEA